MDDERPSELSTQAFVIIAAVCLVVSVALLVLAELLSSTTLAVLGVIPLVLLGVAKWWWWT